MQQRSPLPPSSLIFRSTHKTPKEPNKGGVVCASCKGTRFNKDSNGNLVCVYCSQVVEVLQEANEYEKAGGSYNKGKRRKVDTVPITPDEIMLAIQSVLLMQIETMITKFHCPVQLYNCTFQIWQSYLTYEGDKANTGDKDDSLGGLSEFFKDTVIRGMKVDRSSMHLKLDITLVIIFFACVLLRLPYLSSDFVDWAISGALPFKSVVNTLHEGKVLENILPKGEKSDILNFVFKKAQFVPNVTVLIKKMIKLAAVTSIDLPPVNAPLVCYRLLSQLSLLALFPQIKSLNKALTPEYFTYCSRTYRQSEARTVALIPIAFLQYFAAPGTNKLDVSNWMRKYNLCQQKAQNTVTMRHEVEAYQNFAKHTKENTNLTEPFSLLTKPTALQQNLVETQLPQPMEYTSDAMYDTLVEVCAKYVGENSTSFTLKYIDVIQQELLTRNKKDKPNFASGGAEGGETAGEEGTATGDGEINRGGSNIDAEHSTANGQAILTEVVVDASAKEAQNDNMEDGKDADNSVADIDSDDYEMDFFMR